MTEPNGEIPSFSGEPLGRERSIQMTENELGEHLAHLVWENFSDDLSDPHPEGVLKSSGLQEEDGLPEERVASELLIFLLWAHTRAVQLAFLGTPDEIHLKETLDAMHRAFFLDMRENGLPASQLPLFEQQVSARYSEYHAAASVSDAQLGAAVAAHLVQGPKRSEERKTLASRLTERAIALAHPLKDFLVEVTLR